MFRVDFFAGKHFQYFRTITYNVYEIMCMSSISFMCLFFSPSKNETTAVLSWPLVFCFRLAPEFMGFSPQVHYETEEAAKQAPVQADGECNRVIIIFLFPKYRL